MERVRNITITILKEASILLIGTLLALLIIEIVLHYVPKEALGLKPEEILISNDIFLPHRVYKKGAVLTMLQKGGDLFSIFPGSVVDRKPRMTTFKIDHYGFRNDHDYRPGDYILVGDSFIVGSSNDQKDILSVQLQKNEGIPAYALAFPSDLSGYSTYIDTFYPRLKGSKIFIFLFEGNDFPEGHVPYFSSQTGGVRNTLKKYGRIMKDTYTYRFLYTRLALLRNKKENTNKVLMRKVQGHTLGFFQDYVDRTRSKLYKPCPEFETTLLRLQREHKVDRVFFIPTKYRVYYPLLPGSTTPLPNARRGLYTSAVRTGPCRVHGPDAGHATGSAGPSCTEERTDLVGGRYALEQERHSCRRTGHSIDTETAAGRAVRPAAFFYCHGTAGRLKLHAMGIRQTINSLLRRLGGFSLVRNSTLAQFETRDALLLDLFRNATTPRAKLKKGAQPVACIIFSMDRALQLHALIGSYRALVKHAVPVHILYRTTSAAHEKAYQEVFKAYPGMFASIVEQSSQGSFKTQLLGILSKVQAPAVFFLVDDIVFTEPFDLLAFAGLDTRYSIPTLRMGRNIRKGYGSNAAVPHPTFRDAPAASAGKNALLCWRWSEGKGAWGYPLSVDGHLFSTSEITELLEHTPFRSPNTLEAQLQTYTPLFAHKYGIAYAHSRIVNIPYNKVQDEINNAHGTEHQDTLLNYWQQGKALDHKALHGFNNSSTHQDVPLRLVRRKETRA